MKADQGALILHSWDLVEARGNDCEGSGRCPTSLKVEKSSCSS